MDADKHVFQVEDAQTGRVRVFEGLTALLTEVALDRVEPIAHEEACVLVQVSTASFPAWLGAGIGFLMLVNVSSEWLFKFIMQGVEVGLVLKVLDHC